MKKKKKILNKFFLFGAFFVLVCTIYVIRLVNLQITGVDRYTFTPSTTTVYRESIQALRGEIFDRNGVKLVANVCTYSIEFDYESLDASPSGKNAAIAEALSVLDGCGYEIKTDSPFSGTYPHVEYNDKMELTRIKSRFDNFCRNAELEENVSCIDFYEYLLNRYRLLDSNGDFKIDARYIDLVVAVRYDMETCNFSPSSPYVLVSDAPSELITAVKEHGCHGVRTEVECSREYLFPGSASHILGRVGSIPAEDKEYYLAKDYSLDATVGVDGVEKAFEELLRGVDGVRVIETDENGNIVNSYVEKEAVPGKNVWLTIDIELQQAAEKALCENIAWVKEKGEATGEVNQGEKADSGAVTVINTNTFEVLAMASYPTYDLNTFGEDYSSLTSDEKKPLFNRALFGNYEPGSTFKIATAISALTEGTITASTTIYDSGKYEFYKDYQPRCWLHSGHGNVNVVSALGYSCNIFFYDVGRRLGINTLNSYCTKLGLGEYTGIEISESKGVLASPTSKEEMGGGIWLPGDTLQASIGQSLNAVTPLQLSSYISTVINGGTRYKCTLLYKTTLYSGEGEEYNAPVVLDSVNISEYNVNLIKKGMKMAKENTSTTKKYKFPIGTKTGTAQTSQDSNNALITAFAPYNNPEITVSCVIEQGFAGINAAPTVLKVISHYFNLNEDGSEKTDTPA